MGPTSPLDPPGSPAGFPGRPSGRRAPSVTGHGRVARHTANSQARHNLSASQYVRESLRAKARTRCPSYGTEIKPAAVHHTGVDADNAVSLTDLSGYGRADLTFGADGEDTSDGVILYLPNNSTGPGYGDSHVFGKGTLGTPTDGRLGRTLTP